MSALCVNALTADDMYSCLNRENFPEQIQMQLFQKPRTFSQFFVAFPKSSSNSEYFFKKDESDSLSIAEIIDSERGCYLNV